MHSSHAHNLSQSSQCCSQKTSNIGKTEKTLSLIGGAYLALRGINRGGMTGLLSTAVGAGLLYRGITGHCELYHQLGIDTSELPDATIIPAKQGVHVKKSVSIARPIEEVFGFWNDVENLPRAMTHIKQVTRTSETTSHWVAQAPFGIELEWDAEIFNTVPNELIAWRSLPDSQIETAGSLRFEALPKDRGTAVTLTMKYNPPGGKLSDTIAWFDLESEIDDELRNAKRLLEAQELPTVEGQPHGSRSMMVKMLS